jgi:hypothetical protein
MMGGCWLVKLRVFFGEFRRLPERTLGQGIIL